MPTNPGDGEVHKKFRGKSPEEILEKHGVTSIIAKVDEAATACQAPEMQQLQVGTDAYRTSFTAFKKLADGAHKQVVGVFILFGEGGRTRPDRATDRSDPAPSPSRFNFR